MQTFANWRIMRDPTPTLAIARCHDFLHRQNDCRMVAKALLSGDQAIARANLANITRPSSGRAAPCLFGRVEKSWIERNPSPVFVFGRKALGSGQEKALYIHGPGCFRSS